ncbi:Hypothetical predicted protein [Olea europaea subsp. europaea]|uniref:Membrane-associated kinase regulator 4 n=1 Tax=Olea europaea subsp. europaea TaxID=158383 RepID=A0A8S0QPP4_OLEEU|nr:Hypothetical predicted protein [Olea europaea subsp. europaea]
MDTNFSPSFCADEEDDYIDMDLSFSSTNSPYYSPNSSPQSKDFEFQMSSISNDKGITTSSADELFYKGQLLPLHHPLRLKMHPKNSWSKKMKLMKPSILVQKLKASRACLKSLFCKSACNLEAENMSKFEESSNDEHIKITRKKPSGSMGKSTCPTMSIATITKSIDKEGIGNENVHRRSFSGAIKRHSATKRLSFSSSSSSSISSSGASSSSFSISGFQELYFLKRSSSATKIERSIEAAIAHCKKSQQLS